jgi:fructuronate reductase
VTRLSLETLDRLRPEVARPVVGRSDLRSGIVHLGVGAFHRAHQAVITEDAMAATGDTGWGIIGVSQRSRTVVDQLAPQDGLFSVVRRSPSMEDARVVGSITRMLFAGDEQAAVLDALRSPTTRIVSLTVTEKGYCLAPGGALALSDAAVSADIATLRARSSFTLAPLRTAVGLVAAAVMDRAVTGLPLTVLSCDNLPSNGALLGAAVRSMLEAAGSAWCRDALEFAEGSVSFPSTVVDRMVPVVDAPRRDAIAELIGLRDEAGVLAEPFWQWVMVDDFAAGRPAWDAVGATFVDDVEPYELLKLRVLNATHSQLAYLGALAGYATIAETVQQPVFAAIARRLIHDEAIPALRLPAGLDAHAYGETVMERFGNSALGHQTMQVAMDGSQKLPLRLLTTAQSALDRGVTPVGAAIAYAAWMVFVARGVDCNGKALDLNDPRADELRAAAAGPESSLVERMAAVPGLFSDSLRDSAEWRELLQQRVDRFSGNDPVRWVAV